MERAIPPGRALTTVEQQALSHFASAVKTLLKDNLVSLRLFGSRARGEGDERSDLDVLVVVQMKDHLLCRGIVAVALDADLACGVTLSPTILTLEEYERNRQYNTSFYRNIEREARPL